METDPSAPASKGERTWRFTALTAAARGFIAYAVIALLLVFVIPQFEELFTAMGVTLPAPTRLLLATARAFRIFDVVPRPILLLMHGAIGSGAAFLSYKVAMNQNRISPKRSAGFTAALLIVSLGVVVGLIVLSLFLPLFDLRPLIAR